MRGASITQACLEELESAKTVSLLETVIEVTGFLTQAKVEFLVGGSLASSLWGQERTTRDADIAALISESQLDTLEQLVKWPHVMDARDMRGSLTSGRDFAAGQILHGETIIVRLA